VFKYKFWLQAVLNGDYWICLEQCHVSCIFVEARETFQILVNSSCFAASYRVRMEQKWPLLQPPSPTSPGDHQFFFIFFMPLSFFWHYFHSFVHIW